MFINKEKIPFEEFKNHDVEDHYAVYCDLLDTINQNNIDRIIIEERLNSQLRIVEMYEKILMGLSNYKPITNFDDKIKH